MSLETKHMYIYSKNMCKKSTLLPERTGMLLWLVIDRLDAKEEDNNIYK